MMVMPTHSYRTDTEYKQSKREGHRLIHRSETMIRKRNQLRKGQNEMMRDGKTELVQVIGIRAKGAIRSGACTSPWNNGMN